MSESVAWAPTWRAASRIAGYTITAVYDVNPAAAAELATELGAAACTNLAEVTAAADVIITVVTDDAAMRAIFLDGRRQPARPGRRRQDLHQLRHPLARRSIGKSHAACEAGGAAALEGCMASSITQAREGTLYLMVGGDGKRLLQGRRPSSTRSPSQRCVYVGEHRPGRRRSRRWSTW